MKKRFLSKVLAAVFISSMVLSANAFAEEAAVTTSDNAAVETTADTTTDTTVSDDVATMPEKADMDIYEAENGAYAVFSGKVTSVEAKDGYSGVCIAETGLLANISDDCVVIDAADGTVKKVSDIKEGMQIMVFIGENTPMTMSIPPMSSSISAVVINTDKNVDFSAYGDDFVNSKNNLQLNMDESVKVFDMKGNTVSADDIKGKNALVLYAESTKSIPAQTTPLLVVVADEAKTEEKVDTSDLKIREASEKAGYTVKWTANDKPVEISNGKRTISVTAGESKAVVNNINMTLSEKVYLKDGVMYAPYDFADLLK